MMEPEFHKDEATITPLLVELPSGEWIRGDRITAIRIFEKSGNFKDRVSVISDRNVMDVQFDTIDECREFARSLGRRINGGLLL